MGGCLAIKKSKESDDNRNPSVNRNIDDDPTRILPESSDGGLSPSNQRNSNLGSSSSHPRNENLSPVTSTRRDNLPKHDSRDKNAFTHLEILMATDSFKQENFLGRGGFGSVYKGKLLRLKEVVAIKQIHYDNKESLQRISEFEAETMTLTSTGHPNIVKLHGYCFKGTHRALVYEYMPLRSLDLHLHEVGPDRNALDWNTRMKIAAGVAHALEHIHKALDPPIIHCNVKSSNILLGENYLPKLSGFGFSTEGPIALDTTMRMSGYSAPENAISGHLTVESDIVSPERILEGGFGVVLLEILTGRKVNDQSLVNWAPLFKCSKKFGEMADPLMREFPKKRFKLAMCLAALCVHEDLEKRPEMSKIATALDTLAAIPFPPAEHSGSSGSNTAQRELPSSGGNMQGDQPSSSRNN